jgi:hypothetical protein
VAGVAAGLVGAAALGEPITAAAALLSASIITGLLLGGAARAVTAGYLLRTVRQPNVRKRPIPAIRPVPGPFRA